MKQNKKNQNFDQNIEWDSFVQGRQFDADSDSFRLYEVQFSDAMIHFTSSVHRT
jgi:hypothetical protein